MSKSAETNASHHNESPLKNESAAKDELLSPEKQKLLQEAVKDLYLPPQSRIPTGSRKATDTIMDDRSDDKHTLKIHVSKNVVKPNETNMELERKSSKTDIQNDKVIKELGSPPRHFVRTKDGYVIERPSPLEQPLK